MAALCAATPALASKSTAFSFNFTGPNTALASAGDFAGDTIRVTGSGNFDTAAATVEASGSFTIKQQDGTVVMRGSWDATGFTSFTAFGGPNNGLQGGVLQITVTLTPDSGTPLTGQTMIVNCVINGPPGLEEGTTVGDFTKRTGGSTLFHASN